VKECAFSHLLFKILKKEKKYEKFTPVIYAKERKLGFASNLTYLHPRLMGVSW
jgi:hypothetical protein